MGSTVEELSTEGTEPDEATIREQFNAVVAETGLPITQLALQVGVHPTTLSAWKNAKYTGDNDRITTLVQQYLVTREARRRSQAVLPKEPDFVRTQTSSAILDVLEAAQVLPDIAVISGGAGIGKTTTIAWYRSKASNVWMITMEPAIRSLGALMTEIAFVLDTPKGHSVSFMSRQIRRRMETSGGLLIVDEAQHLSAEALDQLRTFHDLAGVGIALVGNETLARRYGADRLTAENAPLFRRIGQKFRQRGLTKRDLDLLIDGWALADEGAQKVARSVGKMPGAAGLMTKVLRLAHLLARAQDRQDPNQKDVEAAWEQLSARPEGGTA